MNEDSRASPGSKGSFWAYLSVQIYVYTCLICSPALRAGASVANHGRCQGRRSHRHRRRYRGLRL